MRSKLVGVAAAVLILGALAAPTAGAVTCTYSASAYGSAGAPGGGAANDPLFARQWGLTQIKAPTAWTRARGAGATIAVVDTGVDLAHPDLKANLVGGADFVKTGDGCPGPQDENGHGTHVAGIAAAVTGNGIGVAGTAPDAKIMPLRALNAAGEGTDEQVIAAIRHAADNGADVINLSLGGFPGIGQSQALNAEIEAAVDYAWSKGSVIVGAAGNETVPLCSYPGAARYALCVGATDRGGNPSYYSNFPADPDETVGVRAPGGIGSFFCEDDEDVWSTIWPGSEYDCKGGGSLAGYETLAGTSMAAPYAAGVAALLSGQGLTNAQIMECFKKTSSNKGGYDPVYGYGIVDADAATAQCTPATTPSYTPTEQPSGGSGNDGGSGGGGSDGGQPSQGSGQPPGGSPSTGAEGLAIRAVVVRATRSAVARRGLIRVRVTANRAVRGRLVGLMTRRGRRGGKRIGARSFTLRRAGTRTFHVKLSRANRRRLRRTSGARLRVKYAAPGARGWATRARAR